MQKPSLVRICLAISLSLLIFSVVSGALTYVLRVPSSGLRADGNTKFFLDSGGQFPIDHLDWGIVYPFDITEVQVHIKNIGNVPITLVFVAINYIPLEANNLILTTDYIEGLVLQPATIIPIKLILTSVDMSYPQFSFDIEVSSFKVET